jgi:hypothetical protein
VIFIVDVNVYQIGHSIPFLPDPPKGKRILILPVQADLNSNSMLIAVYGGSRGLQTPECVACIEVAFRPGPFLGCEQKARG